jgi:hypothetical protein
VQTWGTCDRAANGTTANYSIIAHKRAPGELPARNGQLDGATGAIGTVMRKTAAGSNNNRTPSLDCTSIAAAPEVGKLAISELGSRVINVRGIAVWAYAVPCERATRELH